MRDQIPFERTSPATVLLLMLGIILFFILLGLAFTAATTGCDGVWVQDVLGVPRCVQEKK